MHKIQALSNEGEQNIFTNLKNQARNTIRMTTLRSNRENTYNLVYYDRITKLSNLNFKAENKFCI